MSVDQAARREKEMALSRSLQRAAHDFRTHLDELTDQLVEDKRAELEHCLGLIETNWPGDRAAQLNVCKWLTYWVQLGEAEDLTDELQREVDFGQAGV